jgi:hypothetical protein
MQDLDRDALDRWITGGRYDEHPTTAWCSNRACGNHQGATVLHCAEYGVGWYEPEECPACGSEWLDEQQPDDDEGDEPHDAESLLALAARQHPIDLVARIDWLYGLTGEEPAAAEAIARLRNGVTS